MNDYVDILKNKLLPLFDKYVFDIRHTEDTENCYSFRASVHNNDYHSALITFYFFYGDFDNNLKNAVGQYNYATYLSIGKDGDEYYEEINLGIINLDNDKNINNAFKMILNALKQLDYLPRLKEEFNKHINGGKVLVHGYNNCSITKPIVSIYENDVLIGKIGRKETWQYKFDKDTYITFKIGFLKKDTIKIRSDLNNEIFLYYDSDLRAKINYITTDFNVEKNEDSLKEEKFYKWSINQYRKIKFRKIVYIITFILSIIYYKGTISSIIFWASLIAIIIHSIRFYTKWNHIGGPKFLAIDQVYEVQIITKLIPKLHQAFNEYGISMVQQPLSNNHPSYETYVGYDRDNNRLDLTFYINHIEMRNENNYKYPMLLKYSYKGIINETIGEIDLSNNKNVENTINLIITTLKDKNLIK